MLSFQGDVGEVALVGFDLSLEVNVDLLSWESALDLGSIGVVLPVGDSISNNPSFKRELKGRGSGSCVVVVNLLDESRDVDSGIGLS